MPTAQALNKACIIVSQHYTARYIVPAAHQLLETNYLCDHTQLVAHHLCLPAHQCYCQVATSVMLYVVYCADYFVKCDDTKEHSDAKVHLLQWLRLNGSSS
jgi:hypothetical protein